MRACSWRPHPAGLVYFQHVGEQDNMLRVVIADDHHLFREGLRGMLEAGGMEVVGEAADGEEAIALARRHAPQVVVLDLHMPGTTGLDALRGLKQTCPGVQAVILTVSDADSDVLEALAAGACGYLLKDTRADRLADSIRQAAEGHMVLSGEIARALMTHVRASADMAHQEERQEDGAPPGSSEGAELTPREVEVLKLISEGADNTAIGRALSISPHTVKQYVTNIFEKLGVRSRVQAAVYAVRAGLV